MRSPAWNDRSKADRRTRLRAGPEHTPWHGAPARAWCSARNTNIPSARAAESTPAQIPRADNASAPRQNPSSTRQCPDPALELLEQLSAESQSLHFTIIELFGHRTLRALHFYDCR